MEKSSQIAWKIVPLRHFFPLKIVPLIEVPQYKLTLNLQLLYKSHQERLGNDCKLRVVGGASVICINEIKSNTRWKLMMHEEFLAVLKITRGEALRKGFSIFISWVEKRLIMMIIMIHTNDN
jgi:hypothetical protein